MPKRQIRYDSGKSITSNASEITGKTVNIVFRNGQVKLAKIEKINATNLTARNMRLKLFEVGLNEISELIIDINA
jgi:hypothetical protein